MVRAGPDAFRWIGPSLGPVTAFADGLADKYRQLAQRPGEAAGDRESARLFASAEDQLDTPQSNLDEASKLASDALAGFKAAGNAAATADAARLVVNALRAKAAKLRYTAELEDSAAMTSDAAGKSGAPRTPRGLREVRAEAEHTARDLQAQFSKDGDARGEACMWLSLAQLSFDDSLPKQQKHEESLQLAAKAAGIFKDLGDKSMEGIAQLLLAAIWCARMDLQASHDAAEKAMAAFQEGAHVRGQALALLAHAAASTKQKKFKEAAEQVEKLSQQQLEDTGVQKVRAAVLHDIAKACLLLGDDSDLAITTATQSYEGFRDLRHGTGWEASALGCAAQAHVAKGAAGRAAKLAGEAAKAAGKRGDRHEKAQIMHYEAWALYSNDEVEEAARVAADAAELCRDLGAGRWQAALLQSLATVHLRGKQRSKALEAAGRAKAVLKELGFTKDATELVEQVTKLDTVADKLTESQKKPAAMDATEKNLAANALVAASSTELLAGEFGEAKHLAEEALEIFRQQRDREGEANALAVLAEASLELEDQEDATWAAQQSLEIWQELCRPKQQADVLKVQAKVQLRKWEGREAIATAEEALQLYSDIGDAKGALSCKFLIVEGNLAYIYTLDPEDSKAKRSIEIYSGKALKAAKQAVGLAQEDAKDLAEAQLRLAEVYQLMQKVYDMFQAAQEAQILFRRCGDGKGQGKAIVLIGQSWAMRQNYKKAKAAFEDGLDLARLVDDTFGYDVCEQLLAQTQEHLSKAAAAEVVPGAATAVVAAAGASSAAPGAAAGAVSAYVPPDIDQVKHRIVALVGELAGGDADGAIDADTPFMDAGIDSLAAVELRSNLQNTFKVQLPSTVMFNYPSVAAIANYIVDEATTNQISF